MQVKPHQQIREAFYHLKWPFLALALLGVLYSALHFLDAEWAKSEFIRRAYAIGSIGFIAWIAVNAVHFASGFFLRRFNIDVKDNYRARMVHTQIKVLRRLVIACICILAISAMLMTFSEIRALGVSLLASAGVAGIVIGFAAQKTIGNFFTGFQIALTQPIRIDDVVVVENEWGRIEEINLTYIVVKLWDLRRLILPITYFTDNPFQNWTRQTSEILGTVMLYMDYSMPIQPIRKELDRLLEDNPLWDGKVKTVQVTDIREQVIEIRVLISAADSGAAFDLGCAIREGLLSFIQNRYSEHFPMTRAQLSKPEDAKIRKYSSESDPRQNPVRAPAPTLAPDPLVLQENTSTETGK